MGGRNLPPINLPAGRITVLSVLATHQPGRWCVACLLLASSVDDTLEWIMTKKRSGTKSKAQQEQEAREFQAELSKSWLSMRTGIIIMAIVSIAFAGFVAWNYVESAGLFKAILIGLMFAGILWAIFIGNYYFNRFLRRKKS